MGYTHSQIRWSRTKPKTVIDIYVKTKSHTYSEVQLTESSAAFVPSIQLTFTQLYQQQQLIFPSPNCFRIVDDVGFSELKRTRSFRSKVP